METKRPRSLRKNKTNTRSPIYALGELVFSPGLPFRVNSAAERCPVLRVYKLLENSFRYYMDDYWAHPHHAPALLPIGEARWKKSVVRRPTELVVASFGNNPPVEGGPAALEGRERVRGGGVSAV